MIKPVLAKLRTGRTGTTLFGSFSRVFALGSQFLVVLILTRLFDKAEFGDFMIVFAGYRVLASGFGTGLASVLLYHISRAGDAGDAVEVRLHRSTLIVGALLALLLCGGAAVGAGAISSAFGKPDLQRWIVVMTPFLFFSIVSTVTGGSLEGRNRVATAIFLTEVAPNAFRLVVLSGLLLVAPPSIWVAHVMALSLALPWAFSILHLFRGQITDLQPLTRWDYGYATKLAFYNFAALQVQGIDMIVAGWLFPSEAVADYAIASRIAALFPFFLQLRVRMFGPIAGRLLGAKRYDELQKEVLVTKDVAMVLVTLTVGGILLVSPIFFGLFWGAGALGLLLLLSAFAPVYRALFAAGDKLIQLAGHANWNLGIMLTALFIVVGFPVLAGGWLGIMSLPIAMMLSGFLLNPVIAYAARRTTGIHLLRRSDAAVVLAAAASVALPLLTLQGSAATLLSGGMFTILGLALWRLLPGMKRMS